MAEEKEGNSNDFLTKSDFQVFIAALKDELTNSSKAEREAILKEFDVRENKIHSSYAKKFKNVDNDVEQPDNGKKASKRELELEEIIRATNDSVKKMSEGMAEKDRLLDEGKKRENLLSHKNSFTETLVKSGFDPKAVETIYKLQVFENNFVEDGKGGFNWKVDANGVSVPLPVSEAVKHFSKSELAETFLPGRTNGGGTKPSVATDSTVQKTDPSRRLPKYEVDWASVNKDMHGDGDGTTAPPFTR